MTDTVPTGHSFEQNPEEEFSLAPIGTAILQGRRRIVLWTFVFGFLGVLIARLPDPLFRSTASFMPQEANAEQLGQLASLADQFLRIPSAQGGWSPQVYLQMLTSRELLVPVLERDFAVSDPTAEVDEGNLLELVGAVGNTHEERIEWGLEWLRKTVLTSEVDRVTGVVAVTVTTKWAELSYQIANALLLGIDDFNSRTRRTQAQAERQFLEARMEAAGRDLRIAEDELQAFLQQNRQFQASPELVFRHDRFRRQVDVSQGVFSGVVEAFEQARIQEVRDTPVITILEHPIIAAIREPRGTVTKTLIGLILGAIFGLVMLIPGHLSVGHSDPNTVLLLQAWGDTKSDFLRFVPGMGRGGKRGSGKDH